MILVAAFSVVMVLALDDQISIADAAVAVVALNDGQFPDFRATSDED